MVDLHTHTNHSDGTWPLIQLLTEAEKVGITTLSVTDHDTVDAYFEMKKINIKDFYNGKLITGAEFNVMFNNSKVELLGYGFDVDKINEWIKKTYTKEKYSPNLDEEFKLLVDACKRNNIKIDDDLSYSKDIGWPIDIVFASLKKYGENKKIFTDKEWNDCDHFFRCCTCNIDFPLYMNFSNQAPDALDVSNMIRACGGKVFLAHLFTYPLRNYETYLDKLREANIIDGIEAYYSKFSNSEISFIEKYCDKYKLLKSGGTDCHGMKKPDRKIGVGYDNMNIKEEMIDWI